MTEQAHDHQVRVPKGAIIAAGLLILFTMATVAVYRVAGLNPTAQVPVPDQPIETRKLRFEDSSEGTVLVYEVRDDGPDQVLHEVQSGEGGFIRGVLRSMARARRASGIGPDQPFLLVVQANGILLLEDPETGQRIFLQAFGPTNIESFRAMLANDETGQ